MMNRARSLGRKLLTNLPVGVQQSYYHYRLSKVSLPTYMRHSREADILALLPETPKTIIDIGANHGKWTEGFLTVLGNEARFHLFEPTPALYNSLTAHYKPHANVHIHDVAVSDTNGTATFYIAESDDLSSLEHFSSESSHIHLGTQSVQVITRTLDDIYRETLQSTPIDLLKIDTQGHEEKIIAASEVALQHTKALLVEWNIIQLYDTASNFASLHACLTAKGFHLSAILNQNRNGHRLAWADALYIHSTASDASA